MKRERCFLIAKERNLIFFPHLLSLSVLRKFLLQKHQLIMQEKWLKLWGGAKGAMMAFGKGHKALAESGSPPDCISPVQGQTPHEDFLSFSATQLCPEQCPLTEKNYPIQVLIFSLPPPPLPPIHMFFNRKNGRWTIESQGPFQCYNSMFLQQLVENW